MYLRTYPDRLSGRLAVKSHKIRGRQEGLVNRQIGIGGVFYKPLIRKGVTCCDVQRKSYPYVFW